MITQEKLKDILEYNSLTGEWIWLHSKKIAGTVQKNGYRYIQIEKKLYQSSRLAYLYMKGKFPDNIVDHIDGNTTNDRWINLRPATMSENQYNKIIPSHNKSGTKGVFWDKRSQRWIARIRKENKTVYSESFRNKEDAIEARKQAEVFYHGEYRRV